MKNLKRQRVSSTSENMLHVKNYNYGWICVLSPLKKQIGNHIIVTSNLFLHCFMIIFHLQKGTNGKMYNKLGSYRNNSLLSNTEGSHRQTIRILVWHWFWVPPFALYNSNLKPDTKYQAPVFSANAAHTLEDPVSHGDLSRHLEMVQKMSVLSTWSAH